MNPKIFASGIPKPDVAQPAQPSSSRLHERSNKITLPEGALSRIIDPLLRLTAGRDHGELKVEAFLFAGDHEVAHAHSTSAYPTDITRLMVANFVRGGAAMSVLCRQRRVPLTVVDVGVKPALHQYGTAAVLQDQHQGQGQGQGQVQVPKEAQVRAQDIPERVSFLNWNVPNGTAKSYPHGARNIVDNSAMHENDFEKVFQRARIWAAQKVENQQLNAVILGEMGIGNTTPATALACWSLELDPDVATGRGTGIDDSTLNAKRSAVKKALLRHKNLSENFVNLTSWQRSLLAMCSLGGFELAALSGAFLGALEKGSYVILDGLIATAAVAPLLIAEPNLKQWCLAGHLSSEPAHGMLLDAFQLKPLLQLDLRLGEGSGAALALGLLQDAVALVTQMSTFDDLVKTEVS